MAPKSAFKDDPSKTLDQRAIAFRAEMEVVEEKLAEANEKVARAEEKMKKANENQLTAEKAAHSLRELLTDLNHRYNTIWAQHLEIREAAILAAEEKNARKDEKM